MDLVLLLYIVRIRLFLFVFNWEGELGVIMRFYCDVDVIGLKYGNSLSECMGKARYIGRLLDPELVGASCLGRLLFLLITS